MNWEKWFALKMEKKKFSKKYIEYQSNLRE